MTNTAILNWMRVHLDREAHTYAVDGGLRGVGPWPAWITREDALARFAGIHLEAKLSDRRRFEDAAKQAWIEHDKAVKK